MAYHTFVSSEVLTASNVMTYLMNQAVIRCTSGTRPGSPSQGMVIFETDTQKLRVYTDAWDYFPGQTVASTTGANTVTSSGLTEVAASSATAGLGLASLSLSSTRPYRIEISGRASATASTAVVVRVRVSTGTVTTGSTQILVGQLITSASGGTGAFDVSLSAPWTPASTGTWNLAVTANSGVTGNASWGPGNANPVITLYGA
jgi:hypothetical protein